MLDNGDITRARSTARAIGDRELHLQARAGSTRGSASRTSSATSATS